MKPLDRLSHDEAIDKLLRIAETLVKVKDGDEDCFLFWMGNELDVLRQFPNHENEFDDQCEIDLIMAHLPEYFQKPETE